MLNLFETLISVIVCLMLIVLAKRWKYYKLHFQVGGPIGLPLIGIVHKVLKREAIIIRSQEYETLFGGLFLAWLGPFPLLFVSEPSIIQEILTSPHCINKSKVYRAIDDSFGSGLLSLNDPMWNVHRKLLNPAFSHKVLASFFPIFNHETNRLLEILDQFSNKEIHDFPNMLNKFTLNLAAETTMGRPIMNDYHGDDVLLSSYRCVIETTTEMAFLPWLRIPIVRRLLGIENEYSKGKLTIQKFVRNLINEKNSMEPNEISMQNNNIVLNLALEQHKKGIFTLTDTESEVNVIIATAFDTTANTIAYTLLMLAMHPEYQEQAFDEIKSLFPDKEGMDVSHEATTQMVYLDMVINETMRILPPVPFVGREASDDFKLANGIVIPKGIQIGINIFGLHRNKEIWGPDAHTFNPDHFLPANLADKHPYAFIPFTKGTRYCIGWRYGLLTAKITLAKLLRNYRFTTDAKLEDLIFIEEITLKLKNFPKLLVHKRN